MKSSSLISSYTSTVSRQFITRSFGGSTFAVVVTVVVVFLAVVVAFAVVEETVEVVVAESVLASLLLLFVFLSPQPVSRQAANTAVNIYFNFILFLSIYFNN